MGGICYSYILKLICQDPLHSSSFVQQTSSKHGPDVPKGKYEFYKHCQCCALFHVVMHTAGDFTLVSLISAKQLNMCACLVHNMGVALCKLYENPISLLQIHKTKAQDTIYNSNTNSNTSTRTCSEMK